MHAGTIEASSDAVPRSKTPYDAIAVCENLAIALALLDGWGRDRVMGGMYHVDHMYFGEHGDRPDAKTVMLPIDERPLTNTVMAAVAHSLASRGQIHERTFGELRAALGFDETEMRIAFSNDDGSASIRCDQAAANIRALLDKRPKPKPETPASH